MVLVVQDDTIAAVATAPGEAGIGIVRVSGPFSRQLLSNIFVDSRGNHRSSFAARRMYLGYIVDKGVRLDQVLVVYMESPNSYSGEDVVEIHAHGGTLIVKEILKTVLQAGARLAEPGEFTKRAFLNGKLDLAQAEAVIDVIRAKSVAALRQAERHLSGELSERIGSIREMMMPILAQLAASVDYPEHDIPEMTERSVLQGIEDMLLGIGELLQTSFAGRVMREGLNLVIVGRPNVGKSSLLNALIGQERAIVTEIAGTTRDVIEEFFIVEGIPVRVADTAGLRETDDPVEQIGVRRARKALADADLALVVLDQSSNLHPEDGYVLAETAEHARIIVLNKSDLGSAVWLDDFAKERIIPVSAKTGEGLGLLTTRIRDMVLEGDVRRESLMIANARQEQLLREAYQSLDDAKNAIIQGVPLDVAGIDLQAAWDKLGMLLGRTVQEDIIDQIFSRFCLGK